MQGYEPNLLSRYIDLSKKPHQALSILVIPIHEKMASGPWTSVGVRLSLSALRCRDDPIPLRYAESGRDHPSPICSVGAIPSLSALRCRVDPISLLSALPGRSHSSSLYHDNEIDGECKKCVDSVPNRIKELLKNGRGYISY